MAHDAFPCQSPDARRGSRVPKLFLTPELPSRKSLVERCSSGQLERLAAAAYPMSLEPDDLSCTEGGQSPARSIVAAAISRDRLQTLVADNAAARDWMREELRPRHPNVR